MLRSAQLRSLDTKYLLCGLRWSSRCGCRTLAILFLQGLLRRLKVWR
uniref:Uncharacterized protein n=1 Tax=Physcomitrium patens TaxID=3218 RepID=A0A2K1JVL0_PHYPA|nr:hypothetical protein PHYPA_015326 [Physcomitrium patens]